MSKIEKQILFWFYNMGWQIAIPMLRLNHRLAEGFEQRTLRQRLPEADIWIQSASVGEAYLSELILKNISHTHPIRVLLTSNTTQGIEILNRAVKDIPLNDRKITAHVAYFPFDKPDLMKKAVKAVHPRLMVLLETEIWPGLFSALKENHSKILIINGRISSVSLERYQLCASLWHEIRPDKILAISEDDAKRFSLLFGMKDLEIMSNMKFDRWTDTSLNSKNPLEKMIQPGQRFLVLGSVGEQEESDIEKMILNISQKFPNTIIGLFPRHTHRVTHWKKRLNQIGIPWRIRSEIIKKIQISPMPRGRVIIWDIFGELPFAYELASAAFVGGSLAPLGGQNFLEALGAGVIPVIGPFWESFEWVGKEITLQGLVRVASDWKEAADMLAENIKDPLSHEAVREAAFKYIKDRQGGTYQACRLINEFL